MTKAKQIERTAEIIYDDQKCSWESAVYTAERIVNKEWRTTHHKRQVIVDKLD